MYMYLLDGALRQLNNTEQEGSVSYRHGQATPKRLFTPTVMRDSPKTVAQLSYAQVQPAAHRSLAHARQPIESIPITGTCATGHSIHVTIVPPNSQQPPTSTQSLLTAGAVSQSLPNTCVTPTLSQHSITLPHPSGITCQSLPVTCIRPSLSQQPYAPTRPLPVSSATCVTRSLPVTCVRPSLSQQPTRQQPKHSCKFTSELGMNNPRLVKIRDELSAGEKVQLMIAFTSGNVGLIASTIWKIPVLRIACTGLFLLDIDTQCHNICTKLNGSNAQLSSKGMNSLVNFDWSTMLQELATAAPDLVDVFVTAAVPAKREQLNKVKCGFQRVPSIGMALAITLHERSSKLNAVQQILSLLMVDGACSKRTFQRFNHLGLCLSPTGTINMLDGMGAYQSARIIQLLLEDRACRVVGDNFDLLIKVRQMLLEHRNKSHHWFNLLVVFSRVSSSHLQNNAPIRSLTTYPVTSYLLNENEMEDILNDFAILSSRVLCEHLKFLSRFKDVLVKHIPHEYSKEMSDKSQVLVCGTLFKDEKKYDEMVDIMDYVQDQMRRYYGEALKDNQDELAEVLKQLLVIFSGDQLTRERAHGSQLVRDGCATKAERLQQILPVVENWHAKQTFLKMIWECLYDTHSARDVGTLYNLRQTIQRNNVPADPKKDVEACEQFMLSVTKSYLTVAAMNFFGLKTVEDEPTINAPSADLLTKKDKKKYLHATMRRFVDQFVPLHQNLLGASLLIDEDKEQPMSTESDVQDDKIHNYSHHVVELGMVLMQLIDTAREGDGERSVRNWKLLTAYFKSCSNHSKYALEGFNFISQVRALLSPRKAHEVIWSQFCSTQGGSGHNLPCDLRMEHFNNEMKKATNAMGANKTPKAVQRISQASAGIEAVAKVMDNVSFVPKMSNMHTYKSSTSDEEVIIQTLLDLKPFEKSCREHCNFKSISFSALDRLDMVKFRDWIKKNQKKLCKHPLYKNLYSKDV